MPDKPYHLSPTAELDLRDIWLYTFRNWSQQQADRYHRDIIAAIVALALGTKQGRVADIRQGYLKFPSGTHVIYFRDRGDRLDIIRVLHARMDAPVHL